MRGLALFALVAILGGCTTVGPDYHLPEKALINAPATRGQFVGAKGLAPVQQAPLPAHWWRLYQSPDLDRLETEALAANTDLRVAEANLQRSRALVSAAKAAGQLNVVLNLDAGRAQLSAEQYLVSETLPAVNLYNVGPVGLLSAGLVRSYSPRRGGGQG